MAAMCDVPPLPSRVVGDADGPQCQALNLSDSQRCRHAATHNNDLFCKFHAFQCFYMYKGYKRRGAELDALLAREPPFLRNSRVALQNQDFEGVTEESELQEIHGFLFNQYVLLRKVISARRLHHAHFYSLDMDYGHKAYLDHLISREQAVHKALESLERRSAVIIFRKEKWFDWVRKEQEEEEENREMEVKKKLKLEHALFRRHWGDMRARLEAARKKEEKKRQEAYLEEVWRERMAAAGSSESDIDWDPIEDIYRDDRARFTDLIRHFLWMDMAAEAAAELEPEPGETSTPVAEASTPATEASTLAGEAATPAAKKKKRGKRKGKPQSAAPANNADSTKNGSAAQTAQQGEPDKNNIESKEDVKKRLMEGVEKDYDHVQGFMLVGGAELPHELYKKTAPYSEEEAERLVSEIAEVKKLLFCRQLLSQPQLLPAALRANSIEEFLADESLPESGLRDLCLKVEKPSLQALRDACADFIRGDQPDHDEAEIDDLEATPPRSAAEFLAHSMRYGSLEDVGRPGTGLFNDLIGLEARKMFDIRALKTAILSMGPKDRKVKIKVCGKAIWNHASQRSMARDGWLHFSIMAKDCSFPEAMSLCRNWDEFANLHFLAGWQYFPASKWSMWTGNMMMDDLVSRGFVPFYREVTAEAETTYNKLSKLTQKALAACPMVVEARNIICAYMKRNDAASRRFIQYTLMSRGEALILVRDGRTGKIVVAPYENERWRRRYIPGYLAPPPGLQSSDDAPWMRDEVDTQFFDKAQARRKWTFGFDSYYEVYVWDNAPGQDVNNLLRLISESLWKAHRVRGLRGKHKIQKHIMEGLTRDPKTMAVRPIKPGEDVQNLYDEVTGPDATYWVRTNSGKQIQTSEDLPPGEGRSLFYNAADAAEDAILFDESLPDHAPFLEITNPLQMFESNGMSPSVLNYKANLLHKRLRPALGLPERELVPVDDAVSDDDDSDWASSVGSDDRHPKPYAPGSDEFNYYLPPLWAQAHRQIQRGKHSKERKDLLRKLDFAYVTLRIPNSGLMTKLGPMEIMERDRSFVFKDTFHLSDLEEGAREKYDVSTKLLRGIQNFVPTTSNLDWVWFCMDNLSWMNLKLHYKSYAPEPLQPWPHRYMAQDITQAFVAMALFFPDLPVASVVHEYLQTEEGSEFKSSPLFNLAERAKYRPTCRTRTSNKFRPNSFWAELDKLTQSSEPICDIYPVEWGIIVRTTIAKRMYFFFFFSL